MSPHQIIAVAVRLFAVWLALYVGITSLDFYALHVDAETHQATWIPLVVLAAAVIVVIVLWFFPLSVARKLLAPPAAPPSERATPDTWLALGCALIGVWTLSYSLPSLVGDGAALYLYGASYVNTGPGIARIIYHLVELAFGAWLIFGAAGFRRIFWWARSAGISRSP